MNFKPCNRYLLVERGQTTTEEEILIALPEGSFTNETRYEKVRVSEISSDVRPPLAVGKEIVVLSHMIEEVDFGSGPIYLVLENHVLGIVEQ
jgi:hypothetical protein